MCKVEKAPSLWTIIPQVQEGASLDSGETVIQKKKKISHKSLPMTGFLFGLAMNLIFSCCNGSVDPSVDPWKLKELHGKVPTPPMGYMGHSVY